MFGQAMACLCSLGPLLLEDYMTCQGSTRLLLLLEWCVGPGLASVSILLSTALFLSLSLSLPLSLSLIHCPLFFLFSLIFFSPLSPSLFPLSNLCVLSCSLSLSLSLSHLLSLYLPLSLPLLLSFYLSLSLSLYQSIKLFIVTC